MRVGQKTGQARLRVYGGGVWGEAMIERIWGNVQLQLYAVLMGRASKEIYTCIALHWMWCKEKFCAYITSLPCYILGGSRYQIRSIGTIQINSFQVTNILYYFYSVSKSHWYLTIPTSIHVGLYGLMTGCRIFPGLPLHLIRPLLVGT